MNKSTNDDNRGVNVTGGSRKGFPPVRDLTNENSELADRRSKDKQPFTKREQRVSFYTTNFASAVEYALDGDLKTSEYLLSSITPRHIKNSIFPSVYQNIRSEFNKNKRLKGQEPFASLYKEFVKHAQEIGYSDHAPKRRAKKRQNTVSREPK